MGCLADLWQTKSVSSFRAPFSSALSLAVDASGTFYVGTSTELLTYNTITDALTSVAGQFAVSGTADGIGTNAQFNLVMALAASDTGELYIADQLNHRIRVLTTPSPYVYSVSTLAGSNQGAEDGTLTSALFNMPAGIAISSTGLIFVSDTGNNLIRLVSTSDMTVTTIGGSLTVAQNILLGISVVTTVGDNDIGVDAVFGTPTMMAVADYTNTLYVYDAAESVIRTIDISSLTYPVYTAMATNVLQGLATDGFDLYGVFSRYFLGKLIVRTAQYTVMSGLIDTPGNVDGTGATTRMNSPAGIVHYNKKYYFIDKGNSKLRVVQPLGNNLLTHSYLCSFF